MAAKSKNDPKAVDSYLATLPNRESESLQKLRTLIKKLVPLADERISYGTTVMFSDRYDLVGFASQKKHLSFFTASPKLAVSMKVEIAKTHQLSGATIHFSTDNPLPETLVEKIIKARVKENKSLKDKRIK
jgi:uncharacterized protein YdhG (YjbR/CyaY superfamily)